LRFPKQADTKSTLSKHSPSYVVWSNDGHIILLRHIQLFQHCGRQNRQCYALTRPCEVSALSYHEEEVSLELDTVSPPLLRLALPFLSPGQAVPERVELRTAGRGGREHGEDAPWQRAGT
jgi:hypothetical protein